MIGDMIVGRKKGNSVVAKMHRIAQNPELRLSSLLHLLHIGVTTFYPSHGEMCSSDAVRDLLEKP